MFKIQTKQHNYMQTKTETVYVLVDSRNGWEIAYSEICPHIKSLLTDGHHIERRITTTTVTVEQARYES